MARTVTLDEKIKEVREIESRTAESPETTAMLQASSDYMKKYCKENDKLVICTDYDTDGITAALQFVQTAKLINPNIEIDVRVNDRRGAYGLTEDTLKGIDFSGKTGLVVLDMGSNQIPMIEEIVGKGVMVIDHHLVSDPEIKAKIISEPNYCNPHVLNDDDSKNAQYCAAGLVFRHYELSGANELATEKQDNTMRAIAAIGTATDMVNVLDEHSYNRRILKEGIEAIDNATPENFDFVIGYMLSQVNISQNTTAHELAFNAGAFLNAGGRMSEIIGENGAARTFAALAAPYKLSTFEEIDSLLKINKDRQHFIGEIVSSPEYQDTLFLEKYGENRENNIAVLVLADDIPHGFAGLVAGRFEEAADKAVICLVKNSETGNYSGSARNPESNETSMIAFMEKILEGSGIDIKYGGHANALGISYLNGEDIDRFKELVESNASLMLRKEKEDMPTIPLTEFNAEDAIDKIKALEPTGIGLQLPCVKAEGTEMNRNKLFKSGRSDWKTVCVQQDGVKYNFQDWSYNELAYPQGEKKSIALTASVGLSQFRGEHIEFTVKFDRGEFLDRVKELGIEPATPEKPEAEAETDKTDTNPNMPE